MSRNRKRAEAAPLDEDHVASDTQTQVEAAAEAPTVENVFGDFAQEAAPPPHALAAKTLTGDLRDFILDRLRHEQDKRPWNQRSEFEQRETVRAVEEAVRAAVTLAIELMAANGQAAIKAHIDSVQIKDVVKAVLVVQRNDPNWHALADAQGSNVLVIVADADLFTGERAPPAVLPDQAVMFHQSGVIHSDADDAEPVL